jgi:hypothetical protein
VEFLQNNRRHPTEVEPLNSIVMRRRRIKLGLYGLTVAEIIPFCQNVTALMAASGNFPTPSPPLADVDAAVDELDKAYKAALDGGKTLKATQREKLTLIYRPATS